MTELEKLKWQKKEIERKIVELESGGRTFDSVRCVHREKNISEAGVFENWRVQVNWVKFEAEEERKARKDRKIQIPTRNAVWKEILSASTLEEVAEKMDRLLDSLIKLRAWVETNKKDGRTNDGT